MRSADIEKSLAYWFKRLELSGYENKKAEQLSKGNQQKVQLVAALVADPELIILDEPLFNAFIYQTIVRNGGFPAHSSQQTNCFHSSLLMCVTATRLNKERDKRLNGQVPNLY